MGHFLSLNCSHKDGSTFLLRLSFSGKACGIFVGTFAEAAFHASRQRDAGLAEFVAQAVGGGESIFPALLAPAI